MKTQTQEKVWNKLAEKWSEYRKKPVDEVLAFLLGKKGKLFVLGCGSGRNMEKQEGLEYYGIDFSDKMLSHAKKKAEELGIKARLSKQNLNKLNFDSEFFDYGIFISTLHCIENEKLRRKSLEELYRILKLGGEAMISVWDKESNERINELGAKESFVNWNKDGENNPRYYYFYDEDELLYLLKDIGFEIIKVERREADSKHSKKNIVVYVRK